jgi:hypothetical protein
MSHFSDADKFAGNKLDGESYAILPGTMVGVGGETTASTMVSETLLSTNSRSPVNSM